MIDFAALKGKLAFAAALAIIITPAMVTSQPQGISLYGLEVGDNADLSWPPNSNPTQLLITPRQGQPLAQQEADQEHSYQVTCEQMQWDPYNAYDHLVEAGYAVVLNRREMERGLVFLAIYGAEVGAVAGALAPGYYGDHKNVARLGASVAVAGELIRTQYLLHEESPTARRVVTRYERNLRQWVRKYSASMRRLGYRID